MDQRLDITSRESLQIIGAQLQRDPGTHLRIEPPSGERLEPRLRCQAPAGLATLPPIQFALAWAAEWARLGYPIIQPTHTYGAALMATQVPREIDIRPPWPTFLVAVPHGLVHLLSRSGEEEPTHSMLCFWQNGRWSFLAPGVSVEYSRTCLTLDDLCRDRLEEGGGWDWWPGSEQEAKELNLSHSETPIEEQDERAAQCLSRLLLNACLAMSDPTVVKQVGKAHQWKPGSPPPKGPRVFELRRAVRVDCRQTVREFIRWGARIPAVQWLVRGHWRNQAHGAQHSQRRLTWIEPYWKGTEGAPLTVRPHDLRGPKPEGTNG